MNAEVVVVAERVKKVFRIQEERKKEYARLERVHTLYCSQVVTEGQYRCEVEAVTSSFSQLSHEMLSLISTLRDGDRQEASVILENIQLAEKEKLQLTVQKQMKWMEKTERERQGKEEEEDELGTDDHEERELRQKLANIEETIASLLTDLRYECESELLALATET